MAGCDYSGYTYRNKELIIDKEAELGDDSIVVRLYKQRIVEIYKLGEKLDIEIMIKDIYPDGVEESIVKTPVSYYINEEYFIRNKIPVQLTIDNHVIKIIWTNDDEEDNFYQYAELTQPDGIVWHGFSGYGVGAGLEDADYGFSTNDRIEKLWELFGK